MAKELRREGVDFVERAPLLIEASVDIAAPPSAVWPAIGDAEAWPEWFGGMKVARYTSPRPHGVGSTRHVRVKGMRADEEILAFDPEQRYAFCVLGLNMGGIAAMVEVVTLEARDGGTRVTYQQALELSKWMQPLAPLLRMQLAGALRKGLAGLDRWAIARAA
jgi:uncharacterized protein YndB with AHSA1/START domain